MDEIDEKLKELREKRNSLNQVSSEASYKASKIQKEIDQLEFERNISEVNLNSLINKFIYIKTRDLEYYFKLKNIHCRLVNGIRFDVDNSLLIDDDEFDFVKENDLSFTYSQIKEFKEISEEEFKIKAINILKEKLNA